MPALLVAPERVFRGRYEVISVAIPRSVIAPFAAGSILSDYVEREDPAAMLCCLIVRNRHGAAGQTATLER
jgi:hypothetical protein